MVAAGTADRDRQARLALRDVRRDDEGQELVEECQEAPRHGLVEHIPANGLRKARKLAQFRDVVRVLHEADVEHEVGLQGDAVLETEADELDCERLRLGSIPEVREDPLAKLTQRQVGRVEDHICFVLDRRQQEALLGDRAGNAALVGQRVAVARFREAANEDLVSRVEEEDLRMDAASLERTAHGGKCQWRIPRANVEHDRDAREALAIARYELGQVRQQLARQVVDDRVAEVLEEFRCGRLPGTRQPTDHHDVLVRGGCGRRDVRGSKRPGTARTGSEVRRGRRGTRSAGSAERPRRTVRTGCGGIRFAGGWRDRRVR